MISSGLNDTEPEFRSAGRSYDSCGGGCPLAIPKSGGIPYDDCLFPNKDAIPNRLFRFWLGPRLCGWYCCGICNRGWGCCTCCWGRPRGTPKSSYLDIPGPPYTPAPAGNVACGVMFAIKSGRDVIPPNDCLLPSKTRKPAWGSSKLGSTDAFIGG